MTTDNNNRFNTREELEVRKNELLTEIRSQIRIYRKHMAQFVFREKRKQQERTRCRYSEQRNYGF